MLDHSKKKALKKLFVFEQKKHKGPTDQSIDSSTEVTGAASHAHCDVTKSHKERGSTLTSKTSEAKQTHTKASAVTSL